MGDGTSSGEHASTASKRAMRASRSIHTAPREKQKPVERLVARILAAKQRYAEANVSALEREIDELVYALYGLTPEEIKIVEGATK
jgi:hypothetical protein